MKGFLRALVLAFVLGCLVWLALDWYRGQIHFDHPSEGPTKLAIFSRVCSE